MALPGPDYQDSKRHTPSPQPLQYGHYQQNVQNLAAMQQPLAGQGMPQIPLQTNFLAGYQHTAVTQQPNQARGISTATGTLPKSNANFQGMQQGPTQTGSQAMALPGSYQNHG